MTRQRMLHMPASGRRAACVALLDAVVHQQGCTVLLSNLASLAWA